MISINNNLKKTVQFYMKYESKVKIILSKTRRSHIRRFTTLTKYSKYERFNIKTVRCMFH